jgi:hypothetical protein
MPQLKIVYIKTTLPELGECAVSINTCVQTHADVNKQIARLNKLAKDRRLNATYELSTRDEYFAHREAVRARINTTEPE